MESNTYVYAWRSLQPSVQKRRLMIRVCMKAKDDEWRGPLYLQQLILCGVGELCMEAVLQNFSYVSHAIATCSNTKQHGGMSNTQTKTTCKTG